MYKTLVRSHLDYCDIIYHIPSEKGNFGLTLNSSIEKVERIQYQAALGVTGSLQGSSRLKLYDELVGNAYLIVVGVGELFRFIKLLVMRRLLISKINYLLTEDHYLIIILEILFMK